MDFLAFIASNGLQPTSDGLLSHDPQAPPSPAPRRAQAVPAQTLPARERRRATPARCEDAAAMIQRVKPGMTGFSDFPDRVNNNPQIV